MTNRSIMVHAERSARTHISERSARRCRTVERNMGDSFSYMGALPLTPSPSPTQAGRGEKNGENRCLLELPVAEHGGDEGGTSRQAGKDDMFVQRVQAVALRSQAVE